MERQKIPKLDDRTLNVLRRQTCVEAIFNSSLSNKIKTEMRKFITRNIIKDCQRVPPNCLKAHLIKTAKKQHLPQSKISRLRKLFKSKIGFMGYYLDSGALKKV
tara:strand:- start:216 stop:527 length:312 start_codon:yes stop_codon:yes gene_type:complete